ncbi:glycosyltransferase family 2 protein [Rhodococcus gannanensis]|uniref:Glycosyltransferase family 2 protein n=1 Tax=Rhodococcus gannanensis TaxID=1960308 RepID=A0ABW4P2G3_9NOCA
MTVAFGLAALSLARFAANSVWLWPLLAVLAVNICGSVISALSGWNRRRISADSHRRTVETWARQNPVGPSVDVFLPTCGEDLDVLRNTYHHVERMLWSGELTVWVLDDADRPEVAAEARAHGFRYLVRPNRGHMKKAGNLQHAYDSTDGEFIVVLDADFCPRPDFLDHLVPYMDDPKVGIVQSPQYFDTSPSMNWLERTAGATQELFYRWVQPSRDAAGAPICVGTCAVYRRAALAATGGFAQIEHSEDVHTGIFLLRAGFATQYVPILVSKGLCPSDTAGFLNQQYRWCNGSITLLRSGNAHRHPLSLRQRICFWAGFMYYISTAINVFAIHIPGVIMAVFVPLEVRAAHFVPFLAGAWVYFVLLPRVSKSTWRFEVMRVQMAYSFCHALAITHKLTGRTKGWVATGAVGKKSSLARTISILGSVTIAVGLVASWGAWGYDVVHYGVTEFWMMAIFLLGYTYLSLPLLVAFLRTLEVIGPPRRPAAPAVAATENRISGYEAVAYTLVIVLLAVVALGGFDLMLPWL